MNNGTVQLTTPITITGGSDNKGIYQVNDAQSTIASGSILKVDITGGNRNVGYFSTQAQTFDQVNSYAFNISEPSSLNPTNNSVAVYANANLDMGIGQITITGGTEGIGLFAHGGTITTTGTIEITGGANGVGSYATGGQTITLNGTGTLRVSSASGSNILLAASPKIMAVGPPVTYDTIAGTINASSRTLQVGVDNGGVSDGNDNLGIYVRNASSANKATVSVDKIKMSGTGTGNIGVFVDETGGVVNINNTNSTIEMDGIEGTGLFIKAGNLEGNIKQIDIIDNTSTWTTSGNVGIFITENGSMTNTPIVNIKGGENNVGLFSNDYSATIDNFKSLITSKDNGNVGVFAGSTSTKNAEITLTNLDIELKNNGIDTSGNNTAIFAQGIISGTGNDGIVHISSGTIKMTMDNNGIGLYTKDEGIINLDGGTLSLDKIGAAVAVDEGRVNLNSGTINYDGNGYVLYFTDSKGGRIDVTGTTINVEGNATVVRRDWNDAKIEAGMISGTKKQFLNLTGGTIKLMEDGITLFGFGDMVGAVTLSDVRTVTSQLKTNLGSYFNSNGIKYKDAKLFDITFEINEDLTINTLTGTPAEQAGDYFKNSLALQRIDLILKSGKTVDVDLAGDQLVGLEMTSAYSTTSPAVSDTRIELESNSTLTVDRTGPGSTPTIINATGIYMNYGEVVNGGIIKVNTAIPANSKGAVGIYAENGSEVQNNGTIEVAGNDAIGIYGRPTRTGTSEFNGTDEEVITIVNDGIITMTNADNSVGIYLDGTYGGLDFRIRADNYALNDTNGVINTGKTTAVSGFASGMYGTYATLENNGKINVDTGAAGIFASNKTKVENVGNIHLSDTGIALVMDKSSYNTSAIGLINVTTTVGTNVSSTNGDSGTVLYLRSDSGSTFDNITNNTIVTSNADNITHIIADKIKLDNQATQTVGDSGIALLAVNEAEITNNATLNTSKSKAIGMAITEKGKIINNGTIDFSASTSNQSIGILGSYDSTLIPIPTSGLELINTGDIKLAAANNAIGIYLTSDTAGAIDLTTNINFVMNGTNTQQIGIYSIGENDIHLDANTGPISFSHANALNNILVYAKDGATIDTLGTTITIDGTGSSEGALGERTIGIYLEKNTKGNTFDSSTMPLAVDGGAIGIYSKGGNVLKLGGLGLTGLEVTGNKTVGAYIIGNDNINGGVKIVGTSLGNPIGVYNNGSVVTIGTNEFLVDITNGIGTGMYATNGGYFTGADITVQNASSDANIGVYYTKGTVATPVTHDTNIIIDASSSEMVGIYADGGIDLSLNTSKAIEVEGTNSIGAMVNGTSTFTNNGSINQDTATGTIGIYAVDGTGVNNTSSTITVDSTDSMGMVAAGDAGKTATIENKGTLAVSNGIGMVVGTSAATTGTSVGKNSNIINVTTANGTGVVLETGANNTFDGTGGTINVSAAAAGIYLDGTVSGQVINTGTLHLSNSSATGIFSDNGSLVDFDITMAGTAGIGLFADNGTIVSKIIDASGSTDTVAMYITDNGYSGSSVTFTSGAKIITGIATSGNSAIGLLMDNMTYNLANVELIADGSDSIASAIVNSTVNSTVTMTLDNNAVGAYVDGTSTLNFDGTMDLGDNTVGVYVDGTSAAATLGATGATVTFNGNDAVAMYAVNGGSVTLGSNITSTGKGALAASENGSMYNTGALTVENQAIGMVGLYNSLVTPGEKIENQSTGNITVKTGGIGMAAVLFAPGTAPATSAVSIINNGTMSVQDQDSVGMFATVGMVQNNGTLTVTDNGIGIYVKDNADIGNLGTINVTGGVGYVAEGLNITGTGTINLNQGTATNYSIGGYYLNVNGSLINVPLVTQADYSIVLAIDGGSANTVAAITGGTASGKNQIGAFVQNTDVTFTGITTIGDENIGVFVSNATVNGTGTITTGTSTASVDKSSASVGMYLDNSTLNASTDTVNAGANTVGIYGKNSNMTIGTVNGGLESVGIYAADGGKATVVNGLNVASSGLGAFAKNADVEVSGNMSIDADTAVGIVSQGTGDVTYNGGIATVANQATSASIAIYKGTGRTTTTSPLGVITETGAGVYTNGTISSSGTMNIGDGGYAIYADNNAETFSTGTITVNNSADINLGMSSVGIYGGGSVVGTNTGAITVGTTYFGPLNDHKDLVNQLNSIGIYGENGANLTNNGSITVNNPLSVGAYITGASTVFTNSASGIINVDHGGVGILAKGSTINNYGIINTGNNVSTLDGVKSIGIAAYADGTNLATVNNYNTINVGEGVGVYLGGKSTLNNSGNILIDKGIGVYGDGTINNSGNITVIPGSSGSTTASLNSSPASHGAITICDTGLVVVNNQFIHTSGTFTATDLVVNGSTVSILSSLNGAQSTPHFVVDTIEGTLKLDSNFITTGNGYGWSIDNFVTMATAATTVDLTITTSPLFVAHMTAVGGLKVAKQPYVYLVSGTQFDNLYNGLDSLLALDQSGTSNDSVVLKNLNAYLDNIYNTYGQEAFNSETSRTLAETRGDVYATIQQRMNGIQIAFDKAFEELANSHNFTKDTGKYSVIYQQGEYKDKTVGIDDYDYKVTGLLYMKEHEGRRYNSKWGYSLGFAVSRFDFDDAPTFGDDSKEDVYSLRAGIHNVHTFDEDDTWTLRSRLEIGYNRHETERTLELDKTYKNKGKFNSYNVSLDNRLSKTLYRSLRSEIKVYGDLNIEYGQIDSFKEKAKGDSGLELKLKQRDYYSVEAALGIQGSTRAHLGGRMSLKLSGDLSYGYDLGNSHDKRVKAKVDGGTEGWYNLIRPEEEDGHVKGVVGLTLEKADNFGVTLELDARKYQHKKDTDVRYGLRFNYKFMN